MKYFQRNCSVSLIRFITGSLAAMLSLPVWSQDCPLPDINSVLADSVVQAGIDTAWANSQEGTTAEHEEGFLIYQCFETVGTQTSFTTELDFAIGTVSSLTFQPTRTDANCRLVAHYHTHPGVGINDPLSNDPYDNVNPSPADLAIGLPGILTYGLGPDHNSGNTTDIVYGPSVNPSLNWACSDFPIQEEVLEDDTNEGIGAILESLDPRPVTYNDPHLITLDNLAYDFMAIGEFFLLESELSGMVIQSRQQQYGRPNSQVTVNTGLAFNVNGDEIAVQFNESNDLLIFLNKEPFLELGVFTMPAGGTIEDTSSIIKLQWLDGSVAEIKKRSTFLNLSLAIADQHAAIVTGLLGNFDGNVDNDITTRDGVDLTTDVTANELYGLYANGWRISDETSLFVYFDGEDTASFTDPLFPGRLLDTEYLTATELASAIETCNNAGLVEGLLFDNCVLDVGATGDVEFAEATAELLSELTNDTAELDLVGLLEVPDLICLDPSLVDISGNSIPDFNGTYTGNLTNPDSRADWATEMEIKQCGAIVTGLMRTERLDTEEEIVYLRRFAGEWRNGQMELILAFPYSYTARIDFNPCTGMEAVLTGDSNTLDGTWTADNCPLGGVIFVTQ